ncbi:L-seryl-tRNA(Sec) selenium transferase [Caminicella sporogenes DSM 14501]|uniref:L-seryl-tRNA(Sec) selenium transferase n=1 Tax=Caminicella sporogenes DSM 14501 TaxID=1121266 RepID=A0A1M6LUB3_9FIRM|nr:L-seryl-tRNA(Sec) selenium transferase [Caminicella sporogenes]RKD27953.1 L-seryl-tRNA(Sec) selenium transferase [Caminicella sporogenes]SHJ74746.1 L-seryl-tRNA(Sec) selenium transferase [Caminicella sporogenes DSM 14501]
MKKKELLSNLPKIDELLNKKEIQNILNEFPRITVVESIRNQVDKLRKKILKTEDSELINFKIDINDLIKNVFLEVKEANQMSLRRVVNATGVVLHTNLGRALISESIKEALLDVVCNYSTLEFDLSSGKRGLRYTHVEEILCKVTGAEAALVVNNNAAAVLLVLNTMAKDREVIVSRGQLVEIGGSFRVPDVMKQSGAKLVEVGTTNKTHLFDYEDKINEETAAILKVHTSNYRILGFTKEVEAEDLVSLGKRYDIPVIEDIGSGTLIDFSKYGLKKEPTVKESLEKGVDIVTFSGDKLLGGPQAGIIVGRKEYIEKMKKNQLTRALRVDKMTLTALEATLRLYLNEEKAMREIPTLRMLTMSIEELREKANKLYQIIRERVKNIEIDLIDGYSQVGGGALPLEKLPSVLIAVSSKYFTANKIEVSLRNYKIPIITRISDEKVILDVRTIKEEEFEIIAEAIKSIESRDEQ